VDAELVQTIQADVGEIVLMLNEITLAMWASDNFFFVWFYSG
jgi:hypothetical protein